MKKRYLAAALVTLAIPAAAVGDATAETVKVVDDFFSPSTVKIKADERVRWKWDGDNIDTHRVVLDDGPKGIEKRDFLSDSGATGVNFNPKFKKPGSYEFICQFHPTLMQMTVTVKR